MDNERVILHSDMNSFYASVEMMLNPELKGKPVAVCGSTEERHGIVLAKSDLAKKAGVKTGMVNWEARQLCPGLIVVPPQYDQYLKYSKLARQIYHRYTDLVEPYGMDECWLDVTGSSICGTGMEIAEAIRQTTKDELGLTVSIGVSFNKIFAKLGSDMKKPDAITEIRLDNFKERIWPLDAAELLYVGRSTENKLAQYGIHTIGDVAKASPETLQHMLGISGIQVTKEVFQTYRRTKWNIEDSTERFFKHETQMSSLIGGENEGYERFHEFIDYENTPENQAIEEMVFQSLRNVLDLLPPKDYELVYELYFKNCTERECAQRLGMSQQAVHERKKRILKKIKNNLDEEGC